MRRIQKLAMAVCICLHLSAGCGLAATVSSVEQLQSAVQNANSGGDRNIFILPGTYLLDGACFRLRANGITVSGQSGDRADVVLDGGYVTTEIFQINACDITVENLTLQHARYHPVHVFPESGDVTGTRIRNVHILDPGQQAVKINQNSAKTHCADYGSVTQCRIELTASGRTKVWEINGSCYTGGVDGHHAAGWEIVGNQIVGFWCEGGLSEHGVHFWSDSRDTLVSGNRIVNCDRGIGFGLGDSGHSGGLIANNMIYHMAGHPYSDVGIGLENAADARVFNNTIFHCHSYSNAIEYRFAGTSGAIIKNNLTNKAIVSRQGGTAELSHNCTTAASAWFADPDAGDLHLLGPVPRVVDAGTAISGLESDFDGQVRPMGDGIDIGADEWPPAGGEKPAVSAWLHLLFL